MAGNRKISELPRSSSGDVVFSAHGLTKTYHMGEVDVLALRGVDADVYAGEFMVLLGPSGSGKSTFLNILGGLDTATGGQVLYKGWDITHATERELTEYRRHHVGFVFQFYNLIPSLSALENVSVVTEIVQSPMKPQDALALVGLARAAQPLSVAALGRGAAARRHSPRHSQKPRRVAL